LKNITENSWWVFAFLLVTLAYLFGLFVDLTGDSGLYAAISRHIVDSGDWFNLKKIQRYH
jgi:4-amino-4-deoxy-L-arabinose transferase-like glycosyltransferase